MSETKLCKSCNKEFSVKETDFAFLEKISPELNGKKLRILAPSLCPECRQQRRMSFRNERKLYLRKCDITGKDIFSIYPPRSPYKVCDKDYWWSDNFDAMQYGRDYDPSRGFFEQFNDLAKDIPLPALRVEKSENSDFNNDVGDCSNCYLCSRTHSCQDCLYTYRGNHSKECVDCMQAVDSELLYECIECVNCNNLNYSSFCNNCSNSSFLLDCRGCSDCFLCTNLRSKQFCFMNQQLSREEYEAKLSTFDFGSFELVEEAKKHFESLKNQAVYKNLTIVNSENCSGDNIVDCKNCEDCFGLKFSEDTRYLWDVMRYKNSMDSYSGGRDSELIYETTAVANSYNCHFCLRATESRNVEYSYFIRSSKNIFGCIGLNHKEFCILNKQYSEDEYYKLLELIITKMIEDGEYGEFFPTSISPSAYNDSVANDYFPLTKEKALSKNYRWQDDDPKEYMPPTREFPGNISGVDQAILKEVFACDCQDCLSHHDKPCGKNFRINPLELAFYLKKKLPIPHKCPDCRHNARQRTKNPMKVRKDVCANCSKEIDTTIPQEKRLKICCEDCYQKAVY